MKLDRTPKKPVDADTDRWYRQVSQQVNGVSEGRMSAFYNAMTAAPTGGTWAQGDFILNKTPSELGTAGSKYVIHGFRCVVSGSPGTWVDVRTLTGN